MKRSDVRAVPSLSGPRSVGEIHARLQSQCILLAVRLNGPSLTDTDRLGGGFIEQAFVRRRTPPCIDPINMRHSRRSRYCYFTSIAALGLAVVVGCVLILRTT